MLKIIDLVILTSIGVISPYAWTWMSSVSFGLIFNEYINNKYLFWLIGSINAVASALFFLAPIGYFLETVTFRHALYFVSVFFFVTTSGMYIVGGVDNIYAFWLSFNTWVFLLSSVVFLIIGNKVRRPKESSDSR